MNISKSAPVPMQFGESAKSRQALREQLQGTLKQSGTHINDIVANYKGANMGSTMWAYSQGYKLNTPTPRQPSMTDVINSITAALHTQQQVLTTLVERLKP